ncbi:MAG: tyrosine-type recombinase/integrase [Bryobacterales bacterium]|nr:tyrosine-type recombinase/integrase [Bryobacterales bacterium]
MTGADLENHLERYLELRRALGFEMRMEDRQLRDFLAFLQGHMLPEPMMAQAAIEWASSRGGQNWQSKRLSMARCFLVHLRAHQPGVQVPASGIIPCAVRPTPYIYSEAQIAALMKAASELGPADSLRPYTYATLVGLLASCGLRPGEAVRLRDADVELEAAPPRMTIRETKFRKSRLVPVDSSTADALRKYASTRKRLGYDGLAQTFFVSESGAPLAYSTVGATFLKMVRGLGLHGPVRSFGPNLRCLRHTFAVRRLLHWYRQGMDVNELLPHLSVYLGHAKPQNTYWYLTATPELLREAASRFESFASHGGER